MLRSLSAASLALVLFSAATAQDSSFRPPAQSAEDLWEQTLGGPIFGSLGAQPQEATITFQLNGEAVESGSYHLLEGPQASLAAKTSRVESVGVFPATTLRQAASEEMHWTTTFPSNFQYSNASVTVPGSVTWQADYADNGLYDGTPTAVTVQAIRSSAATAYSFDEAEKKFYRDNAAPQSLNALTNPSPRFTTLTAQATIHLIAPIAFDRNGDGILRGYNVGIYPNERSDRAPRSVADRWELYAPPKNFYLLNEKSENAKVTKHQTLGSLNPLPIAEDAGKVRYVSVSPRLIKYLQAFETKLALNGLEPTRIHVLRGFVSPTERLRLERGGERIAEFSRHQYGDGIVLVYTDGATKRMSDVNSDGSVDRQDAERLGLIAKEVMDDLGMFGAIGTGSNFRGSDGPFLHIDLRGFYTSFTED